MIRSTLDGVKSSDCLGTHTLPVFTGRVHEQTAREPG